MHAIKRHGKIHPQSFFFFFSFFFFNKRKLKEKQRENEVGQNVGSFMCRYLFERKEFTIKAYSKMILKRCEFCSKRQLSSCLRLCIILASPTALHFCVVTTIVCCADLPNLVFISSLEIFGGLLRSKYLKWKVSQLLCKNQSSCSVVALTGGSKKTPNV